MNRASVISALVVTAFCGAAFMQTPTTIEFGGASLHLGVSEQQVEAAIGSSFRIQRQDSPNFASWSVMAPTGDGGFYSVGSLAFRDGRLTSVRRSWGPADQQAGVELAKALYGAANQMVKEGRRQCFLSVGSGQSPRMEARTIFLQCAGKRLDIQIVEDNQMGNAAFIDEVLERAP